MHYPLRDSGGTKIPRLSQWPLYSFSDSDVRSIALIINIVPVNSSAYPSTIYASRSGDRTAGDRDIVTVSIKASAYPCGFIASCSGDRGV